MFDIDIDIDYMCVCVVDIGDLQLLKHTFMC